MISSLKSLIKSLSHTERLIMIGASAIFVVAAIVYSLVLTDRLTKVVPAYGGTYREGLVGQPVYINPVIAANDTDKDIVALTFSSLSDMADKGSVSKDHLTWTIRLKDNLFWHDGQKVTTDDAIFTIKSIHDPKTNSPLYPTWQGVDPKRVSEFEMTLSTSVPYAFFADSLKDLYVIPKHIFVNVPTANWRTLSAFNLQPVGSGSYKFESIKKEKSGFISEYSLTRNERYFKDRPFIDRVVLVFFPGEDEAIGAFNAAKIDAISGANPMDLGKIKRPDRISNLHLPRYYAVFFNQGSNDMLKNKNVRLALNYATPKDKIIDKVFGGYATRADGPLPFGRIQTEDLAAMGTYNPDQANKILDDAGLKKGDDGFRGEIKLVVPQLKFLTDTADIIKESWDAVGIRTTIIALDPATVNDDAVKTRNYDAILFGNYFTENPDPLSFWHSSERFYPGHNLSLYNSKTADKLMESISKNFDDDSRNKDLTSLQSLIVQDVPTIFLYSRDYVYVSDNNINMVNSWLISSPSNRFESIEKWYIKTKRTFR